MSIERAIEILDNIICFELRSRDAKIGVMLYEAKHILKKEALPPCKRCKHWKYYTKEKAHCTKGWNDDDLVCKFHGGLKDYFEPKEKE